MTHKLTAYVPHVDEFVLLRGAFPTTNVVCQVTAVNGRKAEVVYLAPGERNTTREIRKWVEFRRLMAYDVPPAVPHDRA